MAFDKAVIKALAENEFTDEMFGWLPRKISVQQKWPRPFNADHFFRWSRMMMKSGVLQVYATEGSILGMTVFPHLFTGLKDGVVAFWWSDNDPHSTELWKYVELKARQAGCERIATSVYGSVNADKIARLYRMKGMELSEQSFVKFLR